MGELSHKHDAIKKLSFICKTDIRIKIKDCVQIGIKEIESFIENLPILIR